MNKRVFIFIQMALQAMKDTTLAGTLRRLSPPSSPSKRTHRSTRGPSKILAALDAAMLAENNRPHLTRTIQTIAPIDAMQECVP